MTFYKPNPPGSRIADTAYGFISGVLSAAFIALAHELIHAYHALSGNAETEQIQVTGQRGGNPMTYMMAREEARCVGIGPYRETRISENRIRAEHGFPERTRYATPHDANVFNALPVGGRVAIPAGAIDSIAAAHAARRLANPNWPADPPAPVEDDNWY